MLGGMTQQAERPLGFASPRAAPLTVAPPRPALTPDAGTPPQTFVAPEGPVVPLEAITPAPPESRDPSQPYLDVDDSVAPIGDWRPDQPLVGTRVEEADPPAAVDPSTLPPPTGAPALPAPSGLPAGPYPGTAYPANPYATGPYQAGSQYVPQPYRGPQQAPMMRLVERSGTWVLALLLVGFLLDTIAPYTLVAALITAIAVKSPGRTVLAIAGGFVVAVGVIQAMGYLGMSQWLSVSSLLNLLCLIGVPLVTYNTMRRRS